MNLPPTMAGTRRRRYANRSSPLAQSKRIITNTFLAQKAERPKRACTEMNAAKGATPSKSLKKKKATPTKAAAIKILRDGEYFEIKVNIMRKKNTSPLKQ